MPHGLHDDAIDALERRLRHVAPITLSKAANGGDKITGVYGRRIDTRSGGGRRDKSGRGRGSMLNRSGSRGGFRDGKLHYSRVRPLQAHRTRAKQKCLLLNAFGGFSCRFWCLM
jgi:hypothetical protein